jgi:hypothetical protein
MNWLRCLFKGHKWRLVRGELAPLHYAMNQYNISTYCQKKNNKVYIYGHQCICCKKFKLATRDEAELYEDEYEKD